MTGEIRSVCLINKGKLTQASPNSFPHILICKNHVLPQLQFMPFGSAFISQGISQGQRDNNTPWVRTTCVYTKMLSQMEEDLLIVTNHMGSISAEFNSILLT